VPLILFSEGCAYRRFAIAALKDHKRSWHFSFVSRALNASSRRRWREWGSPSSPCAGCSTLRIVRHGMRLPQLPTVELVYSHGRRSNSRVVSELAIYLADSLSNARPATATTFAL